MFIVFLLLFFGMERPRYIGSWLCESSFWYLPELSIREVTSTQSVCQVAQVCRKIFHSSFFLDNVNTKKRGGLLAFASTNRSILASCPEAWTSPYTTSNARFVCVCVSPNIKGRRVRFFRPFSLGVCEAVGGIDRGLCDWVSWCASNASRLSTPAGECCNENKVGDKSKRGRRALMDDSTHVAIVIKDSLVFCLLTE